MKATGIVRRIDDLGRVVIPKEIRRTLRIREGDPLEIYTDPEGEVIFKKYSPVGEMSPFAAQYAEVLSKTASLPTVICDTDHVIAAAGVSKKGISGTPRDAGAGRFNGGTPQLCSGESRGSSAAGGGNREKRRGGVPDYRLRRCNWRCGYDAGGSRRGAYRSGNQTDSNRGRLLRPSVGGIIDRLSPEKTACGGRERSKEPPTADAS